jgi:hypothetical protein
MKKQNRVDGVQDACLSRMKKAYARTVPILLRVWRSAAKPNARHIPDTAFQGHAGSASVLDRVWGHLNLRTLSMATLVIFCLITVEAGCRR